MLITPNEYECLWVIQERISENFVCTWGIVGGSLARHQWAEIQHTGAAEKRLILIILISSFSHRRWGSLSGSSCTAMSHQTLKLPVGPSGSTHGMKLWQLVGTRHQGCSARRVGATLAKIKWWHSCERGSGVSPSVSRWEDSVFQSALAKWVEPLNTFS